MLVYCICEIDHYCAHLFQRDFGVFTLLPVESLSPSKSLTEYIIEPPFAKHSIVLQSTCIIYQGPLESGSLYTPYPLQAFTERMADTEK